MVALKESKHPGHGHYPFIIIDIRLEFISLSDPETLAIWSSKERGVFAKIYVLTSSKNMVIHVNDEDTLPSC